MTINNATVYPRPDLPLLVVEDMPDLAGGFIAHEVLPILPVAISTAPVPKSLRGATANIHRTKRPKYGAYPTIQNVISSDAIYNCEDNGIEIPRDAKDIEIHGGQDKADLLFGAQALRSALLVQEYAAASLLFTTATFDSGYNAAAAAVWDHATDGKPLNDIANAKAAIQKACGMKANTVVMGYGSYVAMCKCPQVQTAIRNILGINTRGDAAIEIPLSTLSMILNVARILIGEATYNTANEGQTAVMANVWADNCLVCYTDTSSAGLMPGLGRTFVWENGLSGLSAADVQAMPAPLRHVMLELVGTTDNYEKMRARTYQDQLVLNKGAGYLITNTEAEA
jgi:hypothetical protein